MIGFYIFLALNGLFALLSLFLIISFFTGAPYVATPNKTVKEMIQLAHIKPGMTIIDLGSGDGRILIAAAQQGAKAIGWEINPILVAISYLNALIFHKISHIRVHWGNYKTAKLPSADIIFVYGITQHMQAIESQLKKSFHGVTVISYIFQFPHLKPYKTTSTNIHCYKI